LNDGIKVSFNQEAAAFNRIILNLPSSSERAVESWQTAATVSKNTMKIAA